MNELRLPPEDRELSPYTGWTRAHWEAVADHWLLTARRHASPGGGLITPPGRPSAAGIRSDGIEGFARSFLIAAPLLAGHEDDTHDHAGWYARGLAAAMAPGGPDRWGRGIGVDEIKQWNGTPQPIVEAANLAFALAISREQVWDRLDDELRAQTAEWLTHHAVKHGSDNNWLLFTAVIEAFLASVGFAVPEAERHAQADVDLFETWYLGDGWYNDGPITPATGHGNRVDHYNSWVIQPFLWQWFSLSEQQPEERRERFLRRLGEFADSYSLLFAADGSPLHQGRSLTYRQAVLGGLWTAALAGVGGEAAGATRRTASGVLRRFVSHWGVGVAGPPSLGWGAEEFLPMCQVYSGPGSPYFAGMGFLGARGSGRASSVVRTREGTAVRARWGRRRGCQDPACRRMGGAIRRWRGADREPCQRSRRRSGHRPRRSALRVTRLLHAHRARCRRRLDRRGRWAGGPGRRVGAGGSARRPARDGDRRGLGCVVAPAPDERGGCAGGAGGVAVGAASGF
jgi:hypothetical protein